MKIAFLIIDMMRNEKKQYSPLFNQWTLLCDNILAVAQPLKELGAPVYQVVYLADPNIPAVVGEFLEVNNYLLDRGVNLCGGEMALELPIQRYDLISTKNDVSAVTPELCADLRQKGVDTIALAGLWEGWPRKANCCVTMTAHYLVKEGFRVIIVDEATNYATKGAYAKPRARVAMYLQHNIDIISGENVVALAENARLPDGGKAADQLLTRMQQSAAAASVGISSPV